MAKDFLDGELRKYEWKFQINKSIKLNFTAEEQYNTIRNGLMNGKGQGVGQTTILKFLNGELRKYEWNDSLLNKTIKQDFEGLEGKKRYNQIRNGLLDGIEEVPDMGSA